MTFEELRAELRGNPVPDEATITIHTTLGDRFTLAGRMPELRSGPVPPEMSIKCPYCDRTQPKVSPGSVRCVRCSASLEVSPSYAVQLVTPPSNAHGWITLCAIAGLVYFAKIHPNSMGLAVSITLAFGSILLGSFRRGVMLIE